MPRLCCTDAADILTDLHYKNLIQLCIHGLSQSDNLLCVSLWYFFFFGLLILEVYTQSQSVLMEPPAESEAYTRLKHAPSELLQANSEVFAEVVVFPFLCLLSEIS